MLKKFKAKEVSIPKVVAETLAFINRPNAIILIEGNLASGKTTFVKEFVKYFDIGDEVNSPTFSIQNIYGSNIHHYDIYQKGVSEFLKLGLFEMLEESGYHLIEWGNIELASILKKYGFQYWHLKIEILEDSRIYQVSDEWLS